MQAGEGEVENLEAAQQVGFVEEAGSCVENDVLDGVEVPETSLERALELKAQATTLYKERKYKEAGAKYLEAVPYCPADERQTTAILYSNRAACCMMTEDWQDTVDAATNALKADDKYIKALLRRSKAYENLEKYHEALKDMDTVLEIDPTFAEARQAQPRLKTKLEVQQEKQKEEMMGKLKELGNGILGKFGMSLDSFKATKDPKTGGYSISMNNNGN